MQTTHQIATFTRSDNTTEAPSRHFHLPEQPRAPNQKFLCKRVGNVAELRAFVNTHAEEIQSKARILCYGSSERAAEVVQELYPRLLLMLERNPQGFDNTWGVIHQIATRLAIDSYRKYRRQLRTRQLLEPGELSAAARPPPRTQSESEALHNAIGQLPERLKVIVLGIFIEGCKAKDIARRVGLSESRVAELKGSALKQLRWLLSDKEDFRMDWVSANVAK